jgi:signal transduction histidine kinase
MEKNELVELNLEQKKSLLEQLEITNHKLNDIINEKDKLFSIIAHDLRSPLSGFMALSKELSDNIEDLSTEQIVEFANSLKNSSENVYLLLENLLKWSQLQRGTIAFVSEIIYLKYIVDNNISVLLSKSVSKDIELVSYINSETNFIADVNMFNVILRNLLSNAIKFTPRLGKIEIGVVDLDSKYYTNENITIYIKDSGIGIPKDMIEDLFKVNSKNYRNGTENESSSGLGLVLCKEFVAKHNGNIYVESIENIGTTFFVSLPLSQ